MTPYSKVIPPRPSYLLSKGSKQKIKILNTVRTVFLILIMILCFILSYYSATRPFKTHKTKTIPIKTITNDVQGHLFYQHAQEAYSQGDYERARHFISQAQTYDSDSKFNDLSRAIDEALVLQSSFKVPDKRNIQIALKTHLETAKHWKNLQEWDLATIAYQEALILDPRNEDIRREITHMGKLKNLNKKAEKKAPNTIEIYQTIQSHLRNAENYHSQEKYSASIRSYKEAVHLSKRYDLESIEITSRLKEVEEEFKQKKVLLWEKTQSLFSVQEYKDSLKMIQKLLLIAPHHEAAIQKEKELKVFLSEQARQLYSQAVIAEALPDIESAKAKWETILSLVESRHDYYKKAQRKLLRYTSF